MFFFIKPNFNKIQMKIEQNSSVNNFDKQNKNIKVLNGMENDFRVEEIIQEYDAKKENAKTLLENKAKSVKSQRKSPNKRNPTDSRRNKSIM